MKSLYLKLGFCLFLPFKSSYAQNALTLHIMHEPAILAKNYVSDEDKHSLATGLDFIAPEISLHASKDLESNDHAGSDETSAIVSERLLQSMSSPPAIKSFKYKCWLYGNYSSTHKIYKVYVQSLGDSNMTVSMAKKGNNFWDTSRVIQNISISNIAKLKIRKKNSVGKGLLIGAASGFALGGILGLMGVPNYGILDDLPPGENALAGGFVFGIPGIIIGGVLGSLRIKIPINKNQDLYQRQKPLIARYASQ